MITGLPWTIALVGTALGYWLGRRARQTPPAGRRDPVTGLPDKQALLAALQGQLALQRRYHANFSVCLFDIQATTGLDDRNPTLADERLQAFAAGLESCSRETEFVCRYTDSQFAVILPHTSLEGACVYAERVRQTLSRKLSVTVAGSATRGLDGDTRESILMRVDEALFLALAAGGDQIFQHTGLEASPAEILSSTTGHDLAVTQELREGVGANRRNEPADAAAINSGIWAGGEEESSASDVSLPAR